MNRRLTYVLLIAVMVAAWFLARPSGGDDLKTAAPLQAFEAAVAARQPTFVMFTSDT